MKEKLLDLRFAHIFLVRYRTDCVLGSLRDNLIYPSRPGANDEAVGKTTKAETASSMPNTKLAFKTDKELLQILEDVDLIEIARRAGHGNAMLGLNSVMDWSNTLSLGEQQRLSFGRMLVNRPRLAVLDESTSALDVAAETKLYKLLRNSLGDSFTYISVGHRPTLLRHHDFRLSLSRTENAELSVSPIQMTGGSMTTEEVNLFYG